MALLSALLFLLSRHSSEPIVEGKPMSLWFKSITIPQAIGKQPPPLKLSPEVRAFLIRQLKNNGSTLALAYTRIWLKIPDRWRDSLPEPVNYGGRRMNAAYALSRGGELEASVEQALVEAFGDSDGDIRSQALLALFALKQAPGTLLPRVHQAVHDSYQPMRVSAIQISANFLPGNEEAELALAESLADSDRSTREFAYMALLRNPDAIRKHADLIKSYFNNKDEGVRLTSIQALQMAGIKPPEALPILVATLASGKGMNLSLAANLISNLGAAGAPTERFLRNLARTTADDQVLASAIFALGRITREPGESISVLIENLAHTNVSIRTDAAAALGQCGQIAEAAVPALTKVLSDEGNYVRRNALSALTRIGPASHPAIPRITEMLDDPDTAIRVNAALALWKIDHQVTNKKIVPILIEGLEKSHHGNRDLLARAFDIIDMLGEIGPPAKAALPLLEPYREMGPPNFRQAVARAIEKIRQ